MKGGEISRREWVLMFVTLGNLAPVACHSPCSPANIVDTATVEWTYIGVDIGAEAVAVDGSGRIIVLEYERLTALDPDGKLSWTQPLPLVDGKLNAMVVDPDGNIYVGGTEQRPDGHGSIVLAFDPLGASLWTHSEAFGPPGSRSSVEDLALWGSALYSVSSVRSAPSESSTSHSRARRHELATGLATWTTDLPDKVGFSGITGTDEYVVLVGTAYGDDDRSHPFITTLTHDTGDLASDHIEEAWGSWSDVEPIGSDGGLIIVGSLVPPCADLDAYALDSDIAVRRVNPDFTEQSTRTLDDSQLPDGAHEVAVGPDDAILVAGRTNRPFGDANVFGGRFDPDGDLLWSLAIANGYGQDDASSGAFGAGFVVLAGSEFGPYGWKTWVRRIKDPA